MRKAILFGTVSSVLILSQGCKQPSPKSLVKSSHSIVTELTPAFYVLHEAQVGQTLEWRMTGAGNTDFWIYFGKATPCGNGETTLHGSVSHPAACVAGKQDGSTGTVQYSYEIHQDAPPAGGFPDRVGRCVGCTG